MRLQDYPAIRMAGTLNAAVRSSLSTAAKTALHVARELEIPVEVARAGLFSLASAQQVRNIGRDGVFVIYEMTPCGRRAWRIDERKRSGHETTNVT